MTSYYEEDYYRMAFRRILKKIYPNQKINSKLEIEFLSIVTDLKDIYTEMEIHDYVFYNKIV